MSTWKTAMKELSPGVYAYIQADGTWFVSNAGLIVGPEEALVVDSLANAKMVQAFIAHIEQVTDRPVKWLINSHGHGDHTWTNHFFPQAKTICHRLCREMTLAEMQIGPRTYEAMFPHLSFEGAKGTPQDITFEKQLTLYQGDREIRLVYNGPAHTKGDIFIYLPAEGIVFCQDLLFYRCTPLALAGYVSGWIETLDLLASLDAKVYVPGHGPVTDKSGVLESREYLAYIRDESRQRFAAGMEAFAAAQDIPLGKFAAWADPERIVPNVERLYSEFSGKEPGAPLNVMAILPHMKRMAIKLHSQAK
ncbi:MAG TPA: MBL fold metallo-hydrolase [Thermoflexia bacterium]|nr:MBL fold metallo-hydrolase [Thermoflexia bacterium]